MQKCNEYVVAATASGLTPIAAASCYVYLTGTTTLATIYSDDGITTTTNPLTTSSTGLVSFYAADGRYDLSVQRLGYANTVVSDVLLEDVTDASAVVMVGGSVDASPIGATTPSTGVFTTLTSTGNAALGDAEATDTHAIKGVTTVLANSASAALTVTQTGSGNAFVVEDSATPDATPFAVDASGNVASSGYTVALNGTATTAGGLTAGLYMGAALFGVYFGSGAPTITASKGSLYLRSDGSTTNNRMYVNTDGGTTWTAVTTAA